MRYTAPLDALDADDHAPDFEAMSVRALVRLVSLLNRSLPVRYDGDQRRRRIANGHAGHPPRQLTRFTDARRIYAFAWSRDGKRLAIARTSTTDDIVLIKGLN